MAMTERHARMASRKVLPYSHDAERSVLGGILLHPKAFHEVADQLVADDFYHPAHAAIYQAMVELDEASKPIDEVTVADQMRANDTISALKAFNNEGYFSELTSAVVTVENLGYHARIVRGKATARMLIEAAQEIAAKGYGEYGDVDEYLDEAERLVFSVSQRSVARPFVPWRKAIAEGVSDIEARYDRKEAVTGIPSGFNRLDALTAGWQLGDLIIVAARPSQGKTALSMQCAQHAAIDAGVPALVFSIEMGRRAIAVRQLSNEGRVDSSRLRVGHLGSADFLNITKAASRLADAKGHIDDSSAPTMREIRSKARRWRAQHTDPAKPALIVVDYLGLIAPEAASKRRKREENREREVAEISRQLKALAKDLNVALIVLSQLNRSCEMRADKRPQLSDLRDSGSIEQDADVVAFIYRDEVYNKDSDDKGVAEIIIAKQRSGPTGTVRLAFLNQYTRFENLSEGREEHY